MMQLKRAINQPSRKRIFPLGVGLVLLLIIFIAFQIFTGAPQLPLKYKGIVAIESGSSVLIDGINTREGVAAMYKNKEISIKTKEFIGTDIYIALGDNAKTKVIKKIETTTPITSIDTNVTVPKNYKTGLTSFHIYYTNAGGAAVDRRDEVFIAANQTDSEGNGRPNKPGGCNGVVPDSGKDDDKDGKDDACDGYIGPE